LALQGDYRSALAGGSPEEEAALLNNAGFAAGARGDYEKARAFLEQALKTRGEYHARASENLHLIQKVMERRSPQ